MDPQLLRPALRIALLILGLSLLILPFEPRDSAEFVVTVMALVVGAIFAGGVALLARTANPRLPSAGMERKGYNRRDTGRDP